MVRPLSFLGGWLRLYTIFGIEVKYEVKNIRVVDTVDKSDGHMFYRRLHMVGLLTSFQLTCRERLTTFFSVDKC